MRGFGIDATVPAGVAGEVAGRAEELGYTSFWVNGSPPRAALESLSAAAVTTHLDLGVGVLPLTERSVAEIIADVRALRLPVERLWLGIGSARVPGALDEVRGAAAAIRAELGARVATAAVGPRMTMLAGEIADAVLFTWWFAAEVERSRPLLEAGARRADRSAPPIASYIRCALLPAAADALAAKAARYAAIPRYAEVFARNGVTAADTVVTGTDGAGLAPGIAREEAVLDISIVRAITADDTMESIEALLEACAP